MSHTYTLNTLHVVFSTKNRLNLIPPSAQPRFHTYIKAICGNIGIHVHAIGGAPDHLHLLLQVPPVLPVAKAIQTIKANSSKWANEQGLNFSWQEGYAAFSVSASLIPAVTRYIRQQEQHHRKRNFQDELIALLKKHGVDYDPKFVVS
jgi:putative transposase